MFITIDDNFENFFIFYISLHEFIISQQLKDEALEEEEDFVKTQKKKLKTETDFVSL